MTETERKEQRRLEKESSKIEQEIMNNQDMSMTEKMDAWTSLKTELNDKVYEIYGGTPPSEVNKQLGISNVLDFHIDERGTPLIKVPVEKTYTDFELNEK